MSASAIQREMEIQHFKTNLELVTHCEVVILAVKPQVMNFVLDEIKNADFSAKTLISIAAGVSTESIQNRLGKSVVVVRCMPNIAAFVRESATAYCLGKNAQDKDAEICKLLFAPLGKIVGVDESHMDAVTGLSGSGPAYVYVVLESLTDAGIKVGLPRDVATLLAAQTVLGAAKMLMVTGRHPAALKDEVTTPAGCTIDGLLELEEGRLRIALMKAVVKATERARNLAK